MVEKSRIKKLCQRFAAQQLLVKGYLGSQVQFSHDLNQRVRQGPEIDLCDACQLLLKVRRYQ